MRLPAGRCVHPLTPLSCLKSPSLYINTGTLRSYSDKPNAPDKAYFNSTIQLPKTKFPLHQKAESVSSEILTKCVHGVYKWQAQNLPGEPYILHDGPPYANGKLHMGTAFTI
jgi:tRNA synthetases class I (I, L, M and V)